MKWTSAKDIDVFYFFYIILFIFLVLTGIFLLGFVFSSFAGAFISQGQCDLLLTKYVNQMTDEQILLCTSGLRLVWISAIGSLIGLIGIVFVFFKTTDKFDKRYYPKDWIGGPEIQLDKYQITAIIILVVMFFIGLIYVDTKLPESSIPAEEVFEPQECPYECCSDGMFVKKECPKGFKCSGYRCVSEVVERRQCPYECCPINDPFYEVRSCSLFYECLNYKCVQKECPFDCCSGEMYARKECPSGYECSVNSCVKKYKPTTAVSKDFEGICSKLQPTDPTVRNTAVNIASKVPGKWNINQLVEIYMWMKENIFYVSDPRKGYLASASETLSVRAGDCEDLAILTASLIEAVGGTTELCIAEGCQHAFASVYISKDKKHLEDIMNDVINIYANKGYDISGSPYNYYKDEYGNYWLIIDPAGGLYPGDVLPECEGSSFTRVWCP